MKSRQIWFWIALAAGLFVFIFLFHTFKPAPPAGQNRILPELKASSVSSVQVRPSGAVSLAIRAERTNHTWQLVEPLVYPAEGTNVDQLLKTLEALTPATYITAAEIRNRPQAEEEFGFTSPQSTIILQQSGYRAHLLVGSLTAPGDQVFVKVVAREGVYVVDAGLLKLLPRSVHEWRDRSLIASEPALVDRIAVTNNARAFTLQREDKSLWRMVWPLSSARAHHVRTEEALEGLTQLRIRQFVSDDPREDLERLGLDRPVLELALSQGSNAPVILQFGKMATTATNEVYARKLGQDAIFTVDSDALSPWRGAAINDFRNPHLLTLTEAVDAIEVQGSAHFSVQRQTNDVWRVVPDNIPADAARVSEVLFALTTIDIIQFAKDVVNPPELPVFGLASPVLKYSLRSGSSNSSGVSLVNTNSFIVQLDFGIATNGIFVRRTDETSVYAISSNDFARLPSAAWQFRERKLWDVTEKEVAGLHIQQHGKNRELVRKGDYQWSFAPGSQGIINDLAVEETVRGLVRASAQQWVCRGKDNLKHYGLEQPHRVTLHLKNGDKLSLDFGAQASSEAQYAAVSIDGDIYVMEFPWHLYRDVSSYLSIP